MCFFVVVVFPLCLNQVLGKTGKMKVFVFSQVIGIQSLSH